MASSKSTQRNCFHRRGPDLIIDEICNALADPKKVLTFNDLFEQVFTSLKEKNSVSSGEEMMRLRTYEKLQNLSQQGYVTRSGKEYTAGKNLKEASSAQIALRLAEAEATAQPAAV